MEYLIMTHNLKGHGVDMTRRIEAYEAVRQPAQEAYDTVVRSAQEAYDSVVQPAQEAYDAAVQPARAAYDAAVQPARAAYGTAVQSAWDALACGDPLVDWIVARCADYKDEAMEVLRALPADLDTLDDIATVKGWCDAWDDLRTEAIRAGVISR